MERGMKWSASCSLLLLALSSTAQALNRTTTPRDDCLLVGASQTYANLTDAVAALGTGNGTSSACIFLYPGNYTEQVYIQYDGALDMYGWTEDVNSYENNTVTLNYNEGAVEGAPYAGASFTVDVTTFNAYNIDWQNSRGKGIQGLAVYVRVKTGGFYGNRFFGYQDTLFAGYGNQYYSKCYIEGAADFIYGFASAWFSQCDIRTTDYGYIVAMGRNSNDTAWYVIDNSTVDARPDLAGGLAGQSYLGRPWGILSRVIYQRSYLGAVVQPMGWTTMAANATPTFEEWGNWGPGSNTSQREYETKSKGPVTMAQLWPGGYDWIDAGY